MTNQTKQNHVDYLWIPDTRNSTAISEELTFIMNSHKGKISYGDLEAKLVKIFNFNPMMKIDDIRDIFEAHRTESLELYQLKDGIVYDKTIIYKNSIVN